MNKEEHLKNIFHYYLHSLRWYAVEGDDYLPRHRISQLDAVYRFGEVDQFGVYMNDQLAKEFKKWRMQTGFNWKDYHDADGLQTYGMEALR